MCYYCDRVFNLFNVMKKYKVVRTVKEVYYVEAASNLSARKKCESEINQSVIQPNEVRVKGMTAYKFYE